MVLEGYVVKFVLVPLAMYQVLRNRDAYVESREYKLIRDPKKDVRMKRSANVSLAMFCVNVVISAMFLLSNSNYSLKRWTFESVMSMVQTGLLFVFLTVNFRFIDYVPTKGKRKSRVDEGYDDAYWRFGGFAMWLFSLVLMIAEWSRFWVEFLELTRS